MPLVDRWTKKPHPQQIVAEVSKSWGAGEERDPLFLSHAFEEVINVNDARGYELVDWRFDRTWCPAVGECPPCLQETIIAVFRQQQAAIAETVEVPAPRRTPRP